MAKKKPAQRTGKSEERPSGQTLPEGTISFPIYIPGKPEGQIVIPRDLGEADLGILEAMMSAVKAYAERGRKEVTP